MVRNYRSRNRFEKWSKLTNDQIFVLFQFYFMPMYDGVALRDIGVTPRTIKAKYSAFSDRILADEECRTALFKYASPELDDAWRMTQGLDMTCPEFWQGLHTCMFKCPAVIELNLPVTQAHKVPGIRNLQEGQIVKGRIVAVRMQCSACPVPGVREKGKTILQTVTDSLPSGARTTPKLLRAQFLRVLFELCAKLRGGKAQQQVANRDEAHRAYDIAYGICARELGMILARHLVRTPLGSEP